jgi:hypothetical protein
MPPGAAILAQRIPGGHGHEDAGVREEDPNSVHQFPSDYAIVAKGDPRAAPQTLATESGRSNRAGIPSLRAHQLIPAGRDPLGDHAGNFIKILRLRTETGPNRSRAAQTTNLFPGPCRNVDGDAQFTKRRMRTFIATPSARNVNSTEDPP